MSPELLLRIPAILVALTIHEYAHGWVAFRNGDDTARQSGRLTFNPLDHLDLFGTLMLLFCPFGWAKPVPVNPYRLNNPKRDMILVSAAGPVSNIICAFVVGYALQFLLRFSSSDIQNSYLTVFLVLLIRINLGISFFNLLPIPPLDGSKILMGLLPSSKIASYLKIAQKLPMIFVGLIIIEWAFRIRTISLILYPLYIPYRNFWLYLIFGGKVPMS